MSEVEQVTSAWLRVTGVLEASNPGGFGALSPGATDERLGALSGTLQCELPAVLETLLRLNDGSTAKNRREGLPGGGVAVITDPDCAILDGMELLGSQEIVKRYREYLAYAEGDPNYWKPNWIPIIQSQDAPYGFLLAVADGGVSVMEFSEGSYPTAVEWSLAELLGKLAER
ncbi:SMI1/KNR4 family protein [Streptomyces sp. NBC_00009]|uniref:SMI1/KNR4 family protein n=1 Tax=Streptomyces sp. NBC_00009 TaxID=2975620 RepID=UPI00324F68D7